MQKELDIILLSPANNVTSSPTYDSVISKMQVLGVSSINEKI
jgi:hypothetical protein